MTPELKAKWLEALKSGKYTQTTGILNRRTPVLNPEDGSVIRSIGYCCLGVLCEVAGLDKEELPTETVYAYQHLRMTHNIDDAFMELIGLDHAQRSNLIEINDRSSDFEHVIKYIEEKL